MKQGRRKLNKSNFIEDSKLNEIPESKDLQPHFVYFYDSVRTCFSIEKRHLRYSEE